MALGTLDKRLVWCAPGIVELQLPPFEAPTVSSLVVPPVFQPVESDIVIIKLAL